MPIQLPSVSPNGQRYVYDDVPQGTGVMLDTGLGPAPSGYGTEYDRLFQANPYRNLTYKKSFWQQLVSALGFRTDADRWMEDAQVNSAEYDAGIYSIMQQNAYNSPEAMANRERQAGMNPDLLGIGDVANGASPAEDPNGMSSNVADEFSDFGNTISSVFSRAMAIVKDFKSLEQMNAIIDGQHTDNAVKMLGALDGFIESSLTSDDFNDFTSYTSAINRLQDDLSADELLPWKESRVYELGLSERQRKPYYSMMRDKLMSIGTDEKAFNTFKNRALAIAGSQEAKSNPFYFDDAGSESAVDIMVKNLVKVQRRAIELTAEKNAALAAVQNQEAQTLEDMNAGSASAKSQIAEYNSKKAVAQWNSECARIKKDMIQQLERSALAGDWLSKAMLMSWSLDDIARMNVNGSVSLGANFGLSLGF